MTDVAARVGGNLWAPRTRHGRKEGQERFLNRQLSFPVSRMSQWCVSRSSRAAVILVSPPKTDGHSAKLRFVVMNTDVRE